MYTKSSNILANSCAAVREAATTGEMPDTTGDNGRTPTNVRENFRKVRLWNHCVGDEVYASQTESKLGFHTCKSRFCTSCGQRATEGWQQEMDLPEPEAERDQSSVESSPYRSLLQPEIPFSLMEGINTAAKYAEGEFGIKSSNPQYSLLAC